MKLDIGGGLAPVPGFINLDPRHGVGDFRRRIQDGIPLPDCSVEAARCSHLMEHIPAGQERIDLMNEVWRVLIPGGTFEIFVPLFPSWGAIADPTHVSLFVKQSFDYFTGDMRAAADYGMRMWRWVSWTTREYDWGTEGHAVLSRPR